MNRFTKVDYPTRSWENKWSSRGPLSITKVMWHNCRSLALSYPQNRWLYAMLSRENDLLDYPSYVAWLRFTTPKWPLAPLLPPLPHLAREGQRPRSMMHLRNMQGCHDNTKVQNAVPLHVQHQSASSTLQFCWYNTSLDGTTEGTNCQFLNTHVHYHNLWDADKTLAKE